MGRLTDRKRWWGDFEVGGRGGRLIMREEL